MFFFDLIKNGDEILLIHKKLLTTSINELKYFKLSIENNINSKKNKIKKVCSIYIHMLKVIEFLTKIKTN